MTPAQKTQSRRIETINSRMAEICSTSLVEFVLAGMIERVLQNTCFGNYLVFGVIHIGDVCNGL